TSHLRSTHWFPESGTPEPHGTQAPSRQSPHPGSRGGQTTPHEPQFLGSRKVSTQREPHATNPGSHAVGPHVPPAHVAEPTVEAAQLAEQEPQKLGEVDKSTHAPLQLVSGGAHVAAHPLGVHVSLG